MTKMKRYPIDTIIRILFFILILCVLIGFIVGQTIFPSEQNPTDYSYSTFDDNWYIVPYTGEKTPFSLPGTCDIPAGETVILEKILPDYIQTNSWLCFRTSRQDMEIYIDDELRTSFTTKYTRPFGISSASTYLFVELDVSDIGKTIYVKMTSDSSFSGVMRSVLFGDKTGILFGIYKTNYGILILSTIMLILSIALIIITYILQYRINLPLHLTYLGWTLLVVSFWIITQSKMRQFFFPSVSITSSFSYFALYLLPIPLAFYMDSIQQSRYQALYRFYELISLLHFFITTGLVIFNIVDQTTITPSIYVFLGLLIILAILTISRDMKYHYIDDYIFVAIGLFGALFSAFIQVLQSLNKENLLNGNMLCIGFLFLLVLDSIQTAKDILKAEKQKSDALAASEAKAKFLASMSHEIRTPINAVLGFDELIAKETTQDSIKEYAEDIRTAGRSLLAIINDILDFSKIESGKMSIIPIEYDLASVINDSCSITKVKSDEKDLTFEIVCADDLPSKLYGDEIRIRQILINLLSNAIKYTHEGTVTLFVNGEKQDSGHFLLKMTVKDTGIGIKEENIPHIFHSFSRVDDFSTHAIEGTGLGLSIVHNLVELMNGTIQVESTYGEGSSFTVSLPQGIISDLPIRDLSTAYQRTIAAATDSLLAPDAKILVVDDIPVNLKVFCGLLKDTLINIDTASSGREGLMKVKNNHYDIIFLDHMMPDINGIELLSMIKSMTQTHKDTIPVIMLTANAIIGAKEEYLQQGFDDYLSKPIPKDKLYHILRTYLPDELLLKQEQAVSSSTVSSIESIDFLDTEVGLSYHGNDIEFYLEILQMMLHTNHYTELQEYYKNRDWKHYQIVVHSLKGTTKSIGAEQLSYHALLLEDAIKKEDYDYIRTHHNSFMQDYHTLLEKLKTLSLTSSTTNDTKVEDQSFKILVIDDDVLNLKTAEKILSKFFEVICTKSGKEALSYLSNDLVDLILLDVHMPDMDGFTMLKELKQHPATSNIPVIFLTADTNANTEYNSFKAGAMDYIRKPFVPDIMLERINRILEQDRLQQYLQNELKKNETKVEKLSLQAMLSLAQTIDAKDKYTKGHSTRVARYSKKLAMKLGLSEADQDTVYFMGLLHDIGKIGIPDSIINKPHKLTDEEFAVIKRHPEIGYDILKNIAEIPNIESGARWHHERMDGKGYPDGLKGNEIPRLVRIISVADAYDAMTSRRSYRDILPQSFIREELIAGKEKQFDSEVIDAMIELIDEDTEYLMNER